MAVSPRPVQGARNNTSLISRSSSSERDADITLSNELNNGIVSLANTNNRSLVENVAIGGNRQGCDAIINNSESSIRLLKNGNIVMVSNGKEVFSVNGDEIVVGGTKITIKLFGRFLQLLNNISDSDINEVVDFIQEKGKIDNKDIINRRLDAINE